MAIIGLEGMKFHSYHGVFREEELMGNDFEIDIFIHTNTAEASESDDIDKTINYGTVYTICKNVMKVKVQLIERLAQIMVLKVKHQFRDITEISIKIKKLNPPVGGEVHCASFQNTWNFVKNCGRCGGPFTCYEDETCWCNDYRLSDNQLNSIRSQFKGCLCNKCLSDFTSKK